MGQENDTEAFKPSTKDLLRPKEFLKRFEEALRDFKQKIDSLTQENEQFRNENEQLRDKNDVLTGYISLELALYNLSNSQEDENFFDEEKMQQLSLNNKNIQNDEEIEVRIKYVAKEQFYTIEVLNTALEQINQMNELINQGKTKKARDIYYADFTLAKAILKEQGILSFTYRHGELAKKINGISKRGEINLESMHLETISTQFQNLEIGDVIIYGDSELHVTEIAKDEEDEKTITQVNTRDYKDTSGNIIHLNNTEDSWKYIVEIIKNEDFLKRMRKQLNTLSIGDTIIMKDGRELRVYKSLSENPNSGDFSIKTINQKDDHQYEFIRQDNYKGIAYIREKYNQNDSMME